MFIFGTLDGTKSKAEMLQICGALAICCELYKQVDRKDAAVH